MVALEDLLTYGLLSKKELLELSKAAGFTQPSVVELFRWDFEFVSQIQDQSRDFVLKGGAAAQLYIPTAKQRGSVDVDLTFPGQESALAGVVHALDGKFASSAPLFQFNEYVPKNPTHVLPMKTYNVGLPSVLNGRCRIKLDVLLVNLKVPSRTIESAKTFAGTVRNVTCSTAGALIGDKLLTLARNTVGIQRLDDYPKQLYDLEMLTFQRDCGVTELVDAVKAVQVLTPVEASFRNKRVEPADALEDVKATMTNFSSIDLASADIQFKKALNDFQQFYVSKSEMSRKWYEWSSRIFRIRFLASLMQMYFQGKLSPQEMAKLLATSKSISSRLRSTEVREMDKARSELLKLLKGPGTRELRGKPLDRVFWNVVTPENVEELEKTM